MGRHKTTDPIRPTLIRLALIATSLLALSALVGTGALRQLDQAVVDAIQSVDSPWLNAFGTAVGLFGQSAVTGGIALGLAVARWRRHAEAPWAPLLLALVIVIEVALKTLVPQPQPPDELSRSYSDVVPFAHVSFAGAFPSGHVARTAFLAGIVRVPVWLAVLVVALMMGTRVYLADHWPTDVLGGLLLGLLVAQLAAVVQGWLRRH